MKCEVVEMKQVIREFDGKLCLDVFIEGDEIVFVAETGDGPQYGGERIDRRMKIAYLKEEVARDVVHRDQTNL